ncbi:hypothetical protein BJX61DRAFT_541144 [Aspergillus egyptiacus]|nr:hypothetical protein BJX61DRAFT_541144 [Aspergillus egyptiacus]
MANWIFLLLVVLIEFHISPTSSNPQTLPLTSSIYAVHRSGSSFVDKTAKELFVILAMAELMADGDKNSGVMSSPGEQEIGNLKACLKTFYLSSKFTDLTITTSEEQFKFTSSSSAASQDISLACSMEPGWYETSSNKVDLKEDDPRSVETMIDFIYGFAYDTTKHGVTSAMMFHISAYQIADKYDVPKLKNYAKEKFENLVKTCWEMDEFPAAIAETYQTTPMSDEGLRTLVVQVATKHLNQLLEKDSFRKVFGETPRFAADIATNLLLETAWRDTACAGNHHIEDDNPYLGWGVHW